MTLNVDVAFRLPVRTLNPEPHYIAKKARTLNDLTHVRYECFIYFSRACQNRLSFYYTLTHCMLRLLSSDDFFANFNFFSNPHEHYESVKRFGARPGPTFCLP